MSRYLKNPDDAYNSVPCSGCGCGIAVDLIDDSERCEFTDQIICDDCVCYVFDSDMEYFEVTQVSPRLLEERTRSIKTSIAFAEQLNSSLIEARREILDLNREALGLTDIVAETIEDEIEKFNEEFKKRGG